MYKKILFFIVINVFILTGCSQKNNELYSNIKNIDNVIIESASLKHTIEENSKNNLHNKLHSFYKEWEGVRYKYGGNSKSGIDCSAFIQTAYKEKLHIKIPRTTLLQSKVGYEIDKSDLIMGDLVFFRTGKNSRHVGIYLENGKFMHASSKKGVTISKLSNRYYKTHYWKSQRIID